VTHQQKKTSITKPIITKSGKDNTKITKPNKKRRKSDDKPQHPNPNKKQKK